MIIKIIIIMRQIKSNFVFWVILKTGLTVNEY